MRVWVWGWAGLLSLWAGAGAGASSPGLEHDMRGFDDTVLFGLSWPGAGPGGALLEGRDAVDTAQPVPELPPSDEVMKVTTANKEKYACYLPTLTTKQRSSGETYNGPSPLQLLKPLFSQKICSYRLESYWSYELCHGRYLRQYHEEREGKRVKLQEYYLGRWSSDKQKEVEEASLSAQGTDDKPKFTKIDGVSLPYLEIVMEEGTVCDLSGKPRVTKVQYVCYKHGKHEVYSFKETSTCEYEILILSPLLCSHPKYKPQESGENMISCFPLEGSPKKPRSLLAMEAESLKLRHQTVRLELNDKDPKEVVAVLKVEKIEKDGETHLKFELHPLEEEGSLNQITHQKDGPRSAQDFQKNNNPVQLADNSPVKAFLNGENCLNGGTGWWKYEFCYGQSVEQYHVDRTGTRTSVLLGKFDEKVHLEWIRENPHKAPKPAGPHRKSISHLYSGGDLCDRTGKPRQTEVKLKCLENSSASQVSLYLLEPRTCQYILGVESPLICDILPLADDNGLVRLAKSLYDMNVKDDAQDDPKDSKEDKHILDNMNFVND